MAVQLHEQELALEASSSAKAANLKSVTCDGCVDFFDEFEGTLLNALLGAKFFVWRFSPKLTKGGIATCGALCSLIPYPVGQAICDLACIAVGFDEFTNLLNNADLDPIFLCAEVLMCPRNSCTTNCTTIESVTVTPSSAKVRSTFVFSVTVKALAPSGTGLTVVAVKCPLCGSSGQIDFGTLTTGFSAAGQVKTFNMSLDTAEDDWHYPAGTYQFEALSCKYGCGDQEGAIYDQVKGTFQITN